MNILLLNQVWLAEELRNLGHAVFTSGPFPGQFDLTIREPIVDFQTILRRLPADFVPDRLVYYDNGALPWITGLVHTEIPSLYYSVDTHQHPRWHPPYAAVFDGCLIAQKDYFESFFPFQSSVAWFPPWAKRAMAFKQVRTHDAVFRGTLAPELNPHRIEFLSAVSRLAPLDYSSGEYESLYADSRIVLNHCVKGDLNFRVFEAMACGALLITPKIGNGLEELFQSGKDFVSYIPNDPTDAANKIRYFLEREEERQTIARCGHSKIVERHTADIRAVELEGHLRMLKRNKDRKKYVGAAYACLTSASAWGERGLWPSLLLRNSAEALISSVVADEWNSVETMACVVLCREFLERSGEFQAATSFLRKLSESRPDDSTLSIVLLDSLLSSDQIVDARRLAGQLTSNPEKLLQDVPPMVEKLRLEVLSWFYGTSNNEEEP